MSKKSKLTFVPPPMEGFEANTSAVRTTNTTNQDVGLTLKTIMKEKTSATLPTTHVGFWDDGTPEHKGKKPHKKQMRIDDGFITRMIILDYFFRFIEQTDRDKETAIRSTRAENNTVDLTALHQIWRNDAIDPTDLYPMLENMYLFKTVHYLGFSRCRYRNNVDPRKTTRPVNQGECNCHGNGVREYTIIDKSRGQFVYPEGYLHYIEFHNEHPPQAFFDCVMSIPIDFFGKVVNNFGITAEKRNTEWYTGAFKEGKYTISYMELCTTSQQFDFANGLKSLKDERDAMKKMNKSIDEILARKEALKNHKTVTDQ